MRMVEVVNWLVVQDLLDDFAKANLQVHDEVGIHAVGGRFILHHPKGIRQLNIQRV